FLRRCRHRRYNDLRRHATHEPIGEGLRPNVAGAGDPRANARSPRPRPRPGGDRNDATSRRLDPPSAGNSEANDRLYVNRELRGGRILLARTATENPEHYEERDDRHSEDQRKLPTADGPAVTNHARPLQ